MGARTAHALIVATLIASSVVALARYPWDESHPSTPPKTPAASGTESPSDLSFPEYPIDRAPCGTTSAAQSIAFRIAADPQMKSVAREFGRVVRVVLCDKRSWIASKAVRFRYDPRGDLLIGLRTPSESQRRCLKLVARNVHEFYSCGAPGEIVVNSDRWFDGAPAFPASLITYRRMLVNHEVGHALGLHHLECPASGARAPVMMQQSKGMRSANGKTCKPNPWPLPSELRRVT